MATLTRQEREDRIREVTEMAKAGKTQREIAAHYDISVTAIRAFMKRHDIKTHYAEFISERRANGGRRRKAAKRK